MLYFLNFIPDARPCDDRPTLAPLMLGSEIMYGKWSWKNMHIGKITEWRPCENFLEVTVLRY